jgi:uncharacterized protein YyaL (SSP411 family)
MRDNTRRPNSLIHETSPYLLQHAHNPVDWVPFSKAAFETARREKKLVLVSIGYSACHWCHVMEHESFEDPEVAKLMNEGFVCIKVDREERSDVDMLYMQAVQLMSGHGGWPLNCFTLPDGRPFYGGTYFRKEQWMNVLYKLQELYKNEPAKVEEFAGQLTGGIHQAELVTTSRKEGGITRALLQQCVANWKQRLDNTEGGADKAPKFPLPSNYQFLLRYAILEKDQSLLRHVQLTLTKMAYGGIYDQVHGGFARYSTDMQWKLPHFEKMLYDNAQLASLYAEAYLFTKNNLYREICLETLDFTEREWLNPQGGFYSAFDADSDGEEGKYYVWKNEDLEQILGEDFPFFSRYFSINDKGYWEDGNYILMREENVTSLLADFGITSGEAAKIVARCREALRQEARSRIAPGLDDKTVTSWNATMCAAFARSYLCFGIEKHRAIALRWIQFMKESLTNADGGLFRTYKNGEAKINGFLEDYAFVIEALIHCYLISLDGEHLERAARMCEFTMEEFNNPQSDFLYYTSGGSEQLVARTTETSDNVIPSSNSQMALNLFYLGRYFGRSEWISRAEKMLANLTEELKNYGAGYSNWGCLALHLVHPFREVAVVGKDVDEKMHALYRHGLTNAILAGSAISSELPLLKDRMVPGKTMIYICENNTCGLPVESVEEAIEQLD